MVRLAKDPEIKELVVGTEIDLATRLKRENPDKEFYPLRRDAFCLTMKLITLEKIRDALVEEKYFRHCSGCFRFCHIIYEFY